ncbi:DUF4129 domain-containing protein [Streptomyces zingiberis]|uniref:DUF4129 domain-containing protein n=1 Tax=Streptomyces zingiberis TaxID=2053010 RepID=A0ABX1BZ49_9ACTN|nr:DUF4129 domain-containing protein [Streptomyces zingiberis]
MARYAAGTGDGVPITIPRLPAREAAQAELSKQMYQEHRPGLLRRALDRFWEWLDGLMGTAAGVTPGGRIGVLVVLAVIVLLLVALRLRLGSFRRTAPAAAPLFTDRPRTAADHRATAAGHASAGEWAPAIREAMRALVRSLEERALLDPRPGRTADEAATEAGHRLPGHAERLRQAAQDFDAVSYGGRPGTPETYARLRDLDTELRRSRPRTAPAETRSSS